MAIGNKPSGYWNGPRVDRNSPAVRAERISKTAWMDLYYDLFQQVYGEEITSQESVLKDAENRLKILNLNGVRS